MNHRLTPNSWTIYRLNFATQGWNVKKLIRTLVTSDAYKQSSIPSEKLAKADPLNRLYARQSRLRLDAEFVRDSALSISGLLINDIGGKSVKPYQPAGYWQHLNFPARKWQDREMTCTGVDSTPSTAGASPTPAMLAFDAPSREECAAERPRSNIPQQALVLLNDPVFVEAARVFAEKFFKVTEKEMKKIAYAFDNALTRKPSNEEIKVILDLLKIKERKIQRRRKGCH